MAKTIDINRRTLEEERKGFVKMCRLFEITARVIMIITAVLVPFLLVFIIANAAGFIKSEEMFSSAEGMLSMGAMALILGCYTLALNFGVKIFSTMRKCETPFRYDIADKMKGTGYILIVSGIIGFVLNMTMQFFIAYGSLNFETFTYLPDTVPFLFGAFLLALAYVFNYGCRLQQESDETL